MTDAVAAKGTKLEWDDSGSYTTIGEVIDGPAGPTESWDFADVTHHASTNDAMERIPTLLDPGEVTFSVNHTPTKNEHDTLRTRKKNGTKESFRILSPGSNYAFEFEAYVAEIDRDYAPDSQIDADYTLQVTGDVTFNSSP